RSGRLPCELDPVFDRALAKDPAARYATCADLVDSLRSAFDEAAGKTQPRAQLPPRPAPRRPPRRSRARWPLLVALLLGAAIAGSLVAFALTSGGGGQRAQTEHTTTLLKTVRATSPPPPPPAAPPPPASGTPTELVDRATTLERQ